MNGLRYQLIIFDWDGTLMDSIGRIVSSMQSAAIRAGLHLPAEQDTLGIIGMSLHQAIDSLFPSSSPSVRQRVAEGYREAYQISDATPARLFEGVVDLLAALKSEGYRLAVATGKARAGLTRVLQETGLESVFDATVTGDEYHSKPHPAMVEHLLSQFNVMPGEALMIGDSRMDIEMAHAAGVDSVAVGCGAQTLNQLQAFQPTFAIPHTCQLFRILAPRKGCNG